MTARRVSLDGRVLPAESACLSIDDPGVRWGEGLFETMLARNGVIAHLERHLERLQRSARDLALPRIAGNEELREAIHAAVAANPWPLQRVRLTVTPRPTVLVECIAHEPRPGLAERGAAAVTCRGAWCPGFRLAEHKTLSYAGHRLAQRRAEAAGAHQALLLDEGGRLGEASMASAFCVCDGVLVTAPARGLLPGVTRALVIELARAELPVQEEAPQETVWRGADELFLTSAVEGLVPVVACDGAPVGSGRAGPVTRLLQAAYQRRSS